MKAKRGSRGITILFNFNTMHVIRRLSHFVAITLLSSHTGDGDNTVFRKAGTHYRVSRLKWP
jgi:hypothetical protein